MTAQDHSMLRAVIVPAEEAPIVSKAHQLLTDLGHDVSPAASAEQAMDLLKASPSDLLVVDVSNSLENKSLVQQLNDLPRASRPRQIAIFSDKFDESLSAVRKRLHPSHVHVFLKPLHMHGLLGLLRHMDASQPTNQV